ncbi:m-phase inducer phosphatase [Batrachochytrium dendrobatidis]|nr:m-phase inducer phosphatase [Batrachochytrium dendrobatidis]
MFAFTMASPTLSSPCPLNSSTDILGVSSGISNSSLVSMGSTCNGLTPCSPVSSSLSGVSDMVELTGLLNMKSPLSVLANDIGANLFLKAESEAKTPRRCLLQDLETALESPMPTPTSTIGMSYRGNAARSYRKLTRMNTASGRLEAQGTASLFGGSCVNDLSTSSQMLLCSSSNSCDTTSSHSASFSGSSLSSPPQHAMSSSSPDPSYSTLFPTFNTLNKIPHASRAAEMNSCEDSTRMQPKETLDTVAPLNHMFLDQNAFQRNVLPLHIGRTQPLFTQFSECKTTGKSTMVLDDRSCCPVIASKKDESIKSTTLLKKADDASTDDTTASNHGSFPMSRDRDHPLSFTTAPSKMESETVFQTAPAARTHVSTKPSRMDMFTKGGISHWNQRTTNTLTVDSTLDGQGHVQPNSYMSSLHTSGSSLSTALHISTSSKPPRAPAFGYGNAASSAANSKPGRFKLVTDQRLFCNLSKSDFGSSTAVITAEKCVLSEHQRPSTRRSKLPQSRKQVGLQPRLLHTSDNCFLTEQRNDTTLSDSTASDHKCIPLLSRRTRPISTMDMDIDLRTVTTAVCRSILPTQKHGQPPIKMRRANTVIGFGQSEHPEQPHLHHQPQLSLSSPFCTSDETSLLPSMLVPGKDMIRRITVDTLAQVLDGKFDQIESFHLVDCRYGYEYAGGHINGAKNVTSVQDLEHYFTSPPSNNQTVIVFHCEYSAQRAPQMALHFRSMDRNINAMAYPKLHYPHIYVLSGGYREFFKSYMFRCEPQAYVEMTDAQHTEDYKAGVIQNRRQFRKAFSDGFLR